MENSKRRSFKEWFKDLSKPKKALLIAACSILVLMIILVCYVVSKFSKLDTQDISKEDIYVKPNYANNSNKNNKGVTELLPNA